ncbi:MAG: GntR family transcriptional regulator [Rubrivivax sp.]|nr:GntR family transcriptional regulator [Rubrivivax sp.]
MASSFARTEIDKPGPAEGGTAPSFSPLYQQIKGLLLGSLQAAEWKPGEMIPSEIELAGRFKVSQGTVRKAIDELAQENHLVRRQGKGTFVATHAEERTQYRFLRLMPDDGGDGRLQRRLLECRRMRAPAEIARALDLKAGEAAVQVRRLLLSAGAEPVQPVVLDEIWLAGPLFKGLTADKLAGWRGPMYGLFETEFGVRMIRAEEKIRAVTASADEAALLAVAPGSALLLVERLSFTYGDQPVEWRRGLYHTGRFHYRNALN